MSERDSFLALLAAQLAAACPTRVVTRSLRDHVMHKDSDLLKGVLTLLAVGEGNYQNLIGRIGLDARAKAVLIGQLRVPEADENGEKTEPLAIEQAELALFEDVLAALRAGTGVLRCIDVTGFRQSGQIEHPFGWIAVELEWET